jgi:hypothetical protein
MSSHQKAFFSQGVFSMKSFVKFTLALLVVASLLPISEASAGRRHCRRGGCHSGRAARNCGPNGCYTRTCGPSGCQVNWGK